MHRHLPPMAHLPPRNTSLSAKTALKRSTRLTNGTGLPLKYNVSPTSMSHDSVLLSFTHKRARDVLELKMLQRELPRAEQSIDALSSKPFANVFLTNVPIPLLPLNPTTVCASPSPSPPSPPREPTTTPPRDPNPSSPPKRCPRSAPKSLPDQHVIRPHNIPVPPPVPPRCAYPPAPSTPQTHTKLKSNLPPKRTFSFVPLLDDFSHSSRTSTPTSSTTTTPSGGASPVIGSVPAPEPPPLTPLSVFSSSASLSRSGSSSDLDRFDQGYISDCSVTEASTPSLTTASLASSSPPESPGHEHDTFDEHAERGGRARRACEFSGLSCPPMSC